MMSSLMQRVLIGFGVAGLLLLALSWIITRSLSPNIETVATSSLEAMREQNRLSAFAANYSAVVTSEQSRFGLSARKTLIMQGLVRYEIDMAKLNADDVRWDAANKTLQVRLPPIELAGPQIDLKSIQEYGEGGILRTLTDVDRTLDAANRRKGGSRTVTTSQIASADGIGARCLSPGGGAEFCGPIAGSGDRGKGDCLSRRRTDRETDNALGCFNAD